MYDSSTCGGVAGAGGHRGRLQDDGVAAGGQPNRHLLIQDPAWSLSHYQGSLLLCDKKINSYFTLQRKTPVP